MRIELVGCITENWNLLYVCINAVGLAVLALPGLVP